MIHGSRPGDQRQNQQVQHLIHGNSYALKTALAIQSSPPPGTIPAVDQPVGDRDGSTGTKIERQIPVWCAGEPQRAYDGCRIDRHVHGAGQRQQARALAPGHPVVLQYPVAQKVSDE